MAKPQNFCIYCGGPGMSKEEIFPEWLKPYLPRKGSKSGVIRYRRAVETGRLHRTGDRYSRHFREVCRICNNTWMSRIQQLTKPILVPLIRAEHHVLLPPQQAQLAAWIAMTLMTADCATVRDASKLPADSPHPLTSVYTFDDRKAFRSTRRAPDNWRIWIARNVPDPEFPYLAQWKMAIPTLEQEQVSRKRPLVIHHQPANSQLAFFYLGELFVCMLSSQVAHHVSTWDWRRFSRANPPNMHRRLIEIWPPRNEPVFWPRPFVMDTAYIRLVAGAFPAYYTILMEQLRGRRG